MISGGTQVTDFDKTRADDDQQIAEFALSLRNLSFMLSTIAEDESALDKHNLAASLNALNRQVALVSTKLDALAVSCRSCVLGPSEYVSRCAVPDFAAGSDQQEKTPQRALRKAQK